MYDRHGGCMTGMYDRCGWIHDRCGRCMTGVEGFMTGVGDA